MGQKFTNNAAALLATAITATDTSFTVEAAKADRFPVCTAEGDFFKATLEDASGNFEIVKVMRRNAGSSIFQNVVRAQDGTEARSFSVGSGVELRLVASDVEASLAHPTVQENAHNASAIALVPIEGIDAINVQTGLIELNKIKQGNLGFTPLNTAGGTMTGSLVLAGHATTDLNPVAKQQFDNSINSLNSVKLSRYNDTTQGLNNTAWYNSIGNVGWYSTTYGGGIWMADSTWVQVYGGKAFLVNNVIRSGGNSAGWTGYQINNGTDLAGIFAQINHGVHLTGIHGGYSGTNYAVTSVDGYGRVTGFVHNCATPNCNCCDG